MREQFDLLRHVTATLERLGIRYIVTGSMATIYYGEYRTTNDLDIVAAVERKHIPALVAVFGPPEFYMSQEAAMDAVQRHFQFNILHVPTGLKLDIIIPRNTGLDVSEMARAQRVSPEPGYETWMISQEDVILKKLEFYKEGGSDKHLRDIAGVLRISGDDLDRSYVERWAKELGVSEIWEMVVRQENKAS